MVTRIRLVSTSVTSHFFVVTVKSFKIHSLSNFEVYNIVLTVVTMLFDHQNVFIL